MSVLSLDWNATRVRAVLGPADEPPLPVPLEPPGLDLPVAIALDKYAPEVGGAALRQCRITPHLVCQSFLPHLTDTPDASQRWQAGRHSLDARAACELVWRRLQPLAASARGIVLALPGYIHPVQADILRKLAEKARLPILGSAPTLLAAALSAYAEQFWQRSVLVIDVDDHALTIGWVKALGEQAHVIDSRSLPNLGLAHWRERLIDMLAEAFVWQHRRDPRDVPAAEQSLFDQLEPLVDSAFRRQAIQLGVQGPQWFKNMLVRPEQTMQFCDPLARQAAAEAEGMLLNWPASESPRAIVLTHEAARLPGLMDLAQALANGSSGTETKLPPQATGYVEEDFGEDLFLHDEEQGGAGGVLVLPPEAPARAMHALAELITLGAMARGHTEAAAPLIAPTTIDAGPPRLHFEGRDYFLRDASFTIGTQVGCQLAFDVRTHPHVALRHCEIVRDARGFKLHNRCREGTLLNDQPVAVPITLRPGDRIRLGPRGPVLRVLGQLSPRLSVLAS